MNWFALVTLIINILVLVFFILIAIVLNQVRRDKEKYPNVVTVSSGSILWLYIGAIIFAVIAGIQVLTSIAAMIKPEYFGQEKCKKKGFFKIEENRPVPDQYTTLPQQPQYTNVPQQAKPVSTRYLQTSEPLVVS